VKSNGTHVLRFGPFELNSATGELRKHGIRVRLQGKPLQVLLALLESPGAVVTREELQRRLWAEDTFVDFEGGLNTAAKRLRITLGDSADQPRYVETLARSGYRFIAPVIETVPEVTVAPAPIASAHTPRRYAWIYAVCLAAALAGAGLTLLLGNWRVPQATFQQITFRRGSIWSARFAPDGQTILYTAHWEGEPSRLYLSNRVSPEARTVGFEYGLLTSVSPSGELALLDGRRAADNRGADLVRVPLNGGSPLVVSSGIVSSDWSPDGRQLAVIRNNGGDGRIEFPPGNTVYRTAGLLGCVRVSRDGTRLAFEEHPVRGDDGGSVKVVDLHGNVRALSENWASLDGVAWSPNGNEVWFTAAQYGAVRALWAASLHGAVRLVARVPSSMRLEDIARDGTTLVTCENARAEMLGMSRGDAQERDLSWFDWSGVADFSRDGKWLLFDESGEGGRAGWTVYLRNLETGSTVRLGEGRALALDPEGRWAVTLPVAPHSPLTLVEVEGGKARALPRFNLDFSSARVFPDGKRLLVAASEPGSRLRLYIYPLDGSPPRPLQPEIYARNVAISADGELLATADPRGTLTITPATGGESRCIRTPSRVVPLRWSPDGSSILVRNVESMPIAMERVDVRTGKVSTWRALGPSAAGSDAVIRLQVSSDESAYAYTVRRSNAQLYIAAGWRKHRASASNNLLLICGLARHLRFSLSPLINGPRSSRIHKHRAGEIFPLGKPRFLGEFAGIALEGDVQQGAHPPLAILQQGNVASDMSRPALRCLVQSRDGGAIAYLTIENQDKLNTLNSALMTEFAEVVRSLAANEDLRAAVLTGAGSKAFIGGADIDEMATLDTSTAEAFITRLHECCAALRDLPVPVIARIDGYTLGAGLEIAAACDLRVATGNSRFGMPEVRVGIPSVIDAALLPGLIGWGRTRELLYTGEMIYAARALEWGFLDEIVPRFSLDDAIEQRITSILLAGPRAIRLQKKLIRKWENLPLSDAINVGVSAFVEAYETDEPNRMMRDFRERRRSKAVT
jgi:enoyl-CoA hydratase/carnithine racemase/DNA-binding winged helix-turn-helix (wHTH) protein/Tol biopolymer transport system component